MRHLKVVIRALIVQCCCRPFLGFPTAGWPRPTTLVRRTRCCRPLRALGEVVLGEINGATAEPSRLIDPLASDGAANPLGLLFSPFGAGALVLVPLSCS